MSTNNNILEVNIDQLSDWGFRKTINILESIQSKDQERIVLSYEKYLKSERKDNNV